MGFTPHPYQIQTLYFFIINLAHSISSPHVLVPNEMAYNSQIRKASGNMSH